METEDLIGKTITSAEIKGFPKDKYGDECDDEPFLDLEFDDGTKIRIVADYGGYTGKSEDEYPRFIRVEDVIQKDSEVQGGK